MNVTNNSRLICLYSSQNGLFLMAELTTLMRGGLTEALLLITERRSAGGATVG